MGTPPLPLFGNSYQNNRKNDAKTAYFHQNIPENHQKNTENHHYCNYIFRQMLFLRPSGGENEANVGLILVK